MLGNSSSLALAGLLGLAVAVGLVAALVGLALGLGEAVVAVGGLADDVSLKLLKSSTEMLTLSPMLGLMPMSSPPLTAVTPSMLTVRAQLPLQLPHER